VASFPVRDVFEPLGWIFVALLALNVLLLVVLVVLRENWAFFQRRRAAVNAGLSPILERLVQDGDSERAIGELRVLVGGLGRQERPVAAWLLSDLMRDLDEAERVRLRDAFVESGAVALAERSTKRWMPWRRALACEMLGTIGAERSVPVLVERTSDKRSEVRMAATRALGAIGSPDAAPRVMTLFLQRTAVPTGVAYDALRALGSAGAGAFRAGLESPDPTVRVASSFGVAAQPGGETARTALTRVLAEDTSAHVRVAAAKALGVVGGTRAPDALVEAAADGDERLRREAVSALGSFDDPAAVAVLAVAAATPDRETALRAAESLFAVAGRREAGEAATAALAGSTSWSVDYVLTLSALVA
jgi:HEAT repeat protein